eukprot:3940609-Rhodomonas_salina.1
MMYWVPPGTGPLPVGQPGSACAGEPQAAATECQAEARALRQTSARPGTNAIRLMSSCHWQCQPEPEPELKLPSLPGRVSKWSFVSA